MNDVLRMEVGHATCNLHCEVYHDGEVERAMTLVDVRMQCATINILHHNADAWGWGVPIEINNIRVSACVHHRCFSEEIFDRLVCEITRESLPCHLSAGEESVVDVTKSTAANLTAAGEIGRVDEGEGRDVVVDSV